MSVGTASNDGGIGIASGLGYQFYDKNGIVLQANGQSLVDIRKILREGVIQIPSDVHIKILADVTNPLCGSYGATFTFGKQKGLDPSKFQEVDAAIKDFYSKVGPEILKIRWCRSRRWYCSWLVFLRWSRDCIWYPNLFGFDKLRSKSY